VYRVAEICRECALAETCRGAHNSQSDLKKTTKLAKEHTQIAVLITHNYGYDGGANRDHHSIDISPPPCTLIAPLFVLLNPVLGTSTSHHLFVNAAGLWW
jgi:hypothetical protein